MSELSSMRRGSPPAEATRANGGRRRYGLLLFSTFLLLGVQGIGPAGAATQILVAALAGMSLLLAFRAAELGPRLIALAVVLATVVLVLSVVRETVGAIGAGTTSVMNAALISLGPPAVALGVVRDLRASGQVRIEAVAGVLALYMLLGMLFAFVYGAIDRFGDEPFFAGGDDATVSSCLYYSFVTLATVGYGDLVAGSDLGRTLSIFEALLGQIYLVTVVSLIVSNLGRPARGERRAARD